MKKIILKTLTSFDVNLRNSRNDASSLRGSLLIPLLIACLAFLPGAQAAPAPETPDPGSVGGTFNTADGTNVLRNVTTGVANPAFGWFSLLGNTDGSFNTGVGAGTLLLNVGDQSRGDGLENTVVGAVALLNNITGTNIITIGPVTGVHSIFGQVDDRTYIANILGASVDSGTTDPVYVDADGRLGTVLAVAGSESRLPRPATPKANPDAQAMLNRKVEALEATVAKLTAQLKEQAAQIQKVSLK